MLAIIIVAVKVFSFFIFLFQVYHGSLILYYTQMKRSVKKHLTCAFCSMLPVSIYIFQCEGWCQYCYSQYCSPYTLSTKLFLSHLSQHGQLGDVASSGTYSPSQLRFRRWKERSHYFYIRPIYSHQQLADVEFCSWWLNIVLGLLVLAPTSNSNFLKFAYFVAVGV